MPKRIFPIAGALADDAGDFGHGNLGGTVDFLEATAEKSDADRLDNENADDQNEKNFAHGL